MTERDYFCMSLYIVSRKMLPKQGWAEYLVSTSIITVKCVNIRTVVKAQLISVFSSYSCDQK